MEKREEKEKVERTEKQKIIKKKVGREEQK